MLNQDMLVWLAVNGIYSNEVVALKRIPRDISFGFPAPGDYERGIWEAMVLEWRNEKRDAEHWAFPLHWGGVS